ncbi:hypothetical protein [Parahaliea aestuarii]|uniref:Uncharacterized protein n=1 Tax=Parahaliea aestuarii TaxID=1852021 RepID=A0A5C8ZZP0_9GAMM|nr:hypothetical protein [Parahaliea aestuarii]TXS93092.1 hypothetical protein FVW59_04315 [Parahaliea aestuarii]
MMTQERREELSHILRPAAPPREVSNVYSDDQLQRLLGVMRDNGPWQLIIAQHFASAEELLATLSGGAPDGGGLSLDMFLTPTFRGFLANYSAALYPEIQDCFYNERFLDMAKDYWGAKYAKPQMMLFNVNGPCGNLDPGHLDSPSFRGVRYENSPTWLCAVMGKSGLFQDYLIKMAQVITWFSHCPDSGFTYWPNGPLEAPQRLMPPIYNRGVVVQNEMMFHRGEANGPVDQQRPKGLGFDTLFSGDPNDPNQWLLKNGDEVIARHTTDELRFLVHWSAEVFADFDELKKNMDGTDDLTQEKAIEMMIDDVRSQGIEIETPTDPLHDGAFIAQLNAAYDLGGPSSYPEDAPVTPMYTDAA